MRNRGSIGEQWWSRRFIEPLENTGDSGRLSRGRTYARSGAVGSLEVSAGIVTAPVTGSEPDPYMVTVIFQRFSDPLWRGICAELAQQAQFRSALLAGEMPAEAEERFAELGAPLFPEHFDDLQVDCTCPDWGFPCKHVAAVLYTLADAFDDDPFLVLQWLGRDQQALLAEIREHVPEGTASAGEGPDPEEEPPERGLSVSLAPLTAQVHGFWSAPPPPAFTPPRATNPLTHLDTDIPGLRTALETLYGQLGGDTHELP